MKVHRLTSVLSVSSVVNLFVLFLCLSSSLFASDLQRHFPSDVHTYIWRNWTLVPLERMARVLATEPAKVIEIGKAMGLPDPQRIPHDQEKRSYLTVISRNWHILNLDQLLQTLDWKREQFEDLLREDIAFPVKLGGRAPRGKPLKFVSSDDATKAREAWIASVVAENFKKEELIPKEPLFGFVEKLSDPKNTPPPFENKSIFSPRFCHSYFAPYGDFSGAIDPFPEGYLKRLAACGVDGVWLVGRMDKLSPFPWEPRPVVASGIDDNLKNLRDIVARAKMSNVGVYLYLNEPRTMPLDFFKANPDLKGTVHGNFACLCIAHPDVKKYVRDSIAHICRAVPDLAGIFTISGSENHTHCWSHGNGKSCPRCKDNAADTYAEANRLIYQGIQQAGTKTQLIIWDWGWPDHLAEQIISGLPKEATYQSVSEWNLPITRGGVNSIVGEYSISAVGPGPRATKNWKLAQAHGMKTQAKIQANCTWELSSVPYIPAVENVAQHAFNLRQAGVKGLMLGWTLGGCPSPNLEVVAELGGEQVLTVEDAMKRVAERRFGAQSAPTVVEAWKFCSEGFRKFPFHIQTVYQAPLQLGPANPVYAKPTGRSATMTGFPYDDYRSWCSVFKPSSFLIEIQVVGSEFDIAAGMLRRALVNAPIDNRGALESEIGILEAVACVYKSVGNQVHFIMRRDDLAKAPTRVKSASLQEELSGILKKEIQLAQRLYQIQSRDSRIGFEAANQYFYIPLDLVEKVINCRDLLDHGF